MGQVVFKKVQSKRTLFIKNEYRNVPVDSGVKPDHKYKGRKEEVWGQRLWITYMCRLQFSVLDLQACNKLNLSNTAVRATVAARVCMQHNNQPVLLLNSKKLHRKDAASGEECN